MATALELVSVEGPLVGQRFPLPATGSLAVGRTNKGLNLPDPLVSLEHCTIDWTTDRHYVTDLGTPSGTIVDGKRLGVEPVPLLRGMRLQIGESVFVVQQVAGRASFLAPILLVITAIVVVAWGWAAWTTAPNLTPTVAVEGVKIAPDVTVDELEPPLRFVRHWGEDGATLAVSQVTDHDHDGISEVWFTTRKPQTLVVTFGGEGEGWSDPGGVKWRVIGDLPPGCFPTSGLDFPNQQCGIDLYSYEKGQYRLVQQEGYVVWVAAKVGDSPDGPLVPSANRALTPFQFAGVDGEKLESFLVARGVEEPIHYLICENAVPGLAAQVVTESGHAQTLDFGCINDLDIDGNTAKRSFGQYRPAAVALTAAGRRALIDDVTLFLSGSADGAFLADKDRLLRDQLASTPVRRDVNRLVVTAPLGVNSGVARGTLGPTLHALAASPTGTSAPVATALELVANGVTEVDPEGCSKLRIEVTDWNCVMTRLCMPNQTFMSITDVGCGEPRSLLQVPYGIDSVSADEEHLGIRVEGSSRRGSGLVAMLRAKVSWRKTAPPPVVPPAEPMP